jgi:hypothetical protein
VQIQGTRAVLSDGDEILAGAYNLDMHLEKAPLRFAPPVEDAVPADLNRAAAAFTLAGCTMVLLAAILPWAERAAVGFALTTAAGGSAGILLAVPAVISAGIAGAVLLRRPATAGVAIILIGLAVAQVGVGIWYGGNIMAAIDEVHSHQLLIGAIGTGAYLGVLGSVSTFAGGILAWRTREGG